MGCVGSKRSVREYSYGGSKERLTRKESVEKLVSRENSSRRHEVARSSDRFDAGDIKVMLINKKESGSCRFSDNHQVEKSIDKFEVIEEKSELTIVSHPGPGSGRLPNSTEGQLVMAGWPSWLAAVAGDAIKGWIPRKANTFEKLDKVSSFSF